MGHSVDIEIEGRRLYLAVPPPGSGNDIPSVFFLGLPKAGSTLLNRMMQPLAKAAGLAWYAPQEELRALGVRPAAYPAVVNDLYSPHGFAFGGYRGLPGALTMPSFANDRTVLLIRDPRDMLTSLYFSLALSHAPPGTASGTGMKEDFQRRRTETAQTTIDDFVLSNVRVTQGQFRQLKQKLRTIAHKTYRYEDVIFDKQAWVADMLAYLNLDVPSDEVAAAIERNDVRPAAEDVSRHIRRVSPGDHRDKLSAETVEKLNQELSPILAEFGYA